MSKYAFVTRWSVQAPIEAVWKLLSEPEEWPHWWPGVEKVELLEPGSESGAGSLRRFTWKSKLPYRLAFDMRTTRVDRPHRLEGNAEGELQGTGIWQLTPDGDWTHVRYDWQVVTTKAWMNLLTPLARPLFAWNHDVVMGWGAAGLGRRLGCAVRDEP
ncbi:MAG TPA: SRPBCC family protein [Thermoanaerobaculia bacterium]|nr:SRPBCC family protein [Thermoanaerobaculia bacterium]